MMFLFLGLAVVIGWLGHLVYMQKKEINRYRDLLFDVESDQIGVYEGDGKWAVRTEDES